MPEKKREKDHGIVYRKTFSSRCYYIVLVGKTQQHSSLLSAFLRNPRKKKLSMKRRNEDKMLEFKEKSVYIYMTQMKSFSAATVAQHG